MQNFKKCAFFILLLLPCVAISKDAFDFGKGCRDGIPAISRAVVFSGRVVGPEAKKADSLKIHFIRDVIALAGSIEAQFTKSMWFKVKIDGEGYFHFVLPDVRKRGRLFLMLAGAGKSWIINQMYIVEPGDSINMLIKAERDTLVASYSGRGFEKYICSDYLFRELYNFEDVHIGKLREKYKNDFSEFLAQMDAEYLKHDSAKFSYIDGFKLSPAVSLLMKNEVSVNHNLNLLGKIKDAVLGNWLWPNNTREQYKTLYEKYKDRIDSAQFKVLSLSLDWMMLVNFQNITEFVVENGKIPSLLELYEKYKRKYKGELRDRLISQLLLNSFATAGIEVDNAVMATCRVDAFTIVKNSSIKAYLKSQFVVNKGSPAYSFKLMNTNDSLVDLVSYRGKVVLIDAWFTGCTGCMIFHKNFVDSIESIIRNDTSFVIISINADEKKPIWLSSIRTGKYTSPFYVNLAFGDVGADHPMMKYYADDAFPFILLIDRNGKIYEKINSNDITITKKAILSAIEDRN